MTSAEHDAAIEALIAGVRAELEKPDLSNLTSYWRAQAHHLVEELERSHNYEKATRDTICWNVECHHQAEALNWCVVQQKEVDELRAEAERSARRTHSSKRNSSDESRLRRSRSSSLRLWATMTKPAGISSEQLAELRGKLESSHDGFWDDELWEWYEPLLDEVERLRAENERLKALHETLDRITVERNRVDEALFNTLVDALRGAAKRGDAEADATLQKLGVTCAETGKKKI